MFTYTYRKKKPSNARRTEIVTSIAISGQVLFAKTVIVLQNYFCTYLKYFSNFTCLLWSSFCCTGQPSYSYSVHISFISLRQVRSAYMKGR